jgi:homocysteine S-methyltransferase
MSSSFQHLLDAQGFVMLDGALATELERRGADLNHHLWSARVLAESPELILGVYEDYLAAGADIIASASYQASFEGFEKAGFTREQAAHLFQLSVNLAVLARESFWSRAENRRSRMRPLVAASLGPYGACLADGSEYRGDYGLTREQLMDFHRPRIQALVDTDADLYAFETVPSRLEAEALLAVLREFPGSRAILSFSCKDENAVCHGESFAECAQLVADSDQVLAVGINCTAPRYLAPLLQSARSVTKPLAAYPNSGEEWVAGEHRWSGRACDPLDAVGWYAAGARVIGGCCRTRPEDIRRMRADLVAHLKRT